MKKRVKRKYVTRNVNNLHVDWVICLSCPCNLSEINMQNTGCKKNYYLKRYLDADCNVENVE